MVLPRVLPVWPGARGQVGGPRRKGETSWEDPTCPRVSDTFAFSLPSMWSGASSSVNAASAAGVSVSEEEWR